MRNKILKGERLKHILSESVKVNRIFFKSQNLLAFENLPNAESLTGYCMKILNEIIGVVRPKTILCESLATFETLCSEGVSILDKTASKKTLLWLGQYQGIELLGINHPSQAHWQGITDADWELVNKKLEDILQ